MATKKPTRPDFVQTAAKSGKEARESFQFDLQRRLNDQQAILSADDLSGLYEPGRGLFTTIDGKPRILTLDDLLAFRAAVRDLKNRHKGKQYRGGIKPNAQPFGTEADALANFGCTLADAGGEHQGIQPPQHRRQRS